MNGLDMLDSLAAELAERQLPVVILTTEGQREAMARAKKSGAKAWIVKPFKQDLLLAAVQKLTQSSASNAPPPPPNISSPIDGNGLRVEPDARESARSSALLPCGPPTGPVQSDID